MNPWEWGSVGWGAVGGSVGLGTVLVAAIRAVSRWWDGRTQRRRDDAAVSIELRDDLMMERAQLRARVAAMEDKFEGVLQQLAECEHKSEALSRENRLLRRHARRLAKRISTLEQARVADDAQAT